jgi:hypothetical protein
MLDIVVILKYFHQITDTEIQYKHVLILEDVLNKLCIRRQSHFLIFQNLCNELVYIS